MLTKIENSASPDIVIKRLRKSYSSNGRRLNVIQELTFTVGEGELVAIIGPSGCGKSTLLRILSGAEKEDSAEIFFVNPERRASAASIEQLPALFPWRTAFQNAHLGTEIRKARPHPSDPTHVPDDALLKKKITDDFALFGLKGFENSYPNELSGGMQQRVAIIRALQSEPKMLFCDEPFSSIDFVTRLYLNTEFKKQSDELGCTTVFVTHNIEEAIFLADRIFVLSRRPCTVVDEFAPRLTVHPEDAVKCRQSPEFPVYFERIWKKICP